MISIHYNVYMCVFFNYTYSNSESSPNQLLRTNGISCIATRFLSYGREYADAYLGHGIGPVPGYGVST